MKLIIEPKTKENLYIDKVDGLVLSLENYSVQSEVYFSLKEIEEISKNKNLEIFVNINKNIFNNEIEDLEKIMLELDKLNLKGILFYDLGLLEIKKELNLKTDLVWNQTHMVNNYKTCDYYYEHGAQYALLGKEITLDEILEIKEKSKSTLIVEVVSKPTVAYSRRKLITNYYKDINKEPKEKLMINEKITGDDYELSEDSHGTNFLLNKITNGTSVINTLYNSNIPYILMKEYGIPNFEELLIDTKKYIEGNCQDEEYITKYKKLGDFTNFFFKKTIYQVKKNG